MKTKFKKDNIIKATTLNQNNRGIRSNFYACECFDLESESNETVVAWLDWREPFGRLVPVWMLSKDNPFKD